MDTRTGLRFAAGSFAVHSRGGLQGVFHGLAVASGGFCSLGCCAVAGEVRLAAIGAPAWSAIEGVRGHLLPPSHFSFCCYLIPVGVFLPCILFTVFTACVLCWVVLFSFSFEHGVWSCTVMDTACCWICKRIYTLYKFEIIFFGKKSHCT